MKDLIGFYTAGLTVCVCLQAAAFGTAVFFFIRFRIPRTYAALRRFARSGKTRKERRI